MNEHKQECMTRAEAVAVLIDLSRNRHIDERDVTALQMATRALLKKIFGSERNWKRRHAAETIVPEGTPPEPETQAEPPKTHAATVTRWGLWCGGGIAPAHLCSTMFATREAAEAHPREMAEYYDGKATAARTAGDEAAANAAEVWAEDWRKAVAHPFPIAVPPCTISNNETTTTEEK